MNKIYPPIRTAQYQLWQHGGMFWDGSHWRKGEANTGMQYMYGGQQYPPIRTAQYQLWENGGPVETAAYDMYKDGGIHIKKSQQGSLHRHLGIPEGEKIPASDLQDKPGDSPAIKKKKLFARNARSWKHQYGGLSKFIDGGEVDPWGRPAMPQEVSDQYQQYQEDMLYSDPVALNQARPNKGLPGVTPDRANPQERMVGESVPRKKRNPWQGMGYATNALSNSVEGLVDAGMAAGSYINNMNNARDVHRGAQTMGLTGMSGHINGPGLKGDYNKNTGMFRPEQYVPANAGYYAPAMGQYGGQYEHGGYVQNGEYELSDAEIARLRKMGYKIQEL